MIYRVIPPRKELRNTVSHFWEATWDATKHPPNATHYIIANSLSEITFAFDGNRKDSELLFSTIQGQTTQPNRIPVKGFYHLLGVSLYTYALPRLFKISASDLNCEFLNLDTFLGNEATRLTDRIASANSTDERIELLSSHFMSLMDKRKVEDLLINDAIGQVKRKRGILKISELSKEYNLSQKQFKRRFQSFSGFNPKTYARIIRFESLIKNIDSRSNLTEAAYANGYYDQAHLNREFKAFTGFSPNEFWKLSD
ncbi:helix-turn-helix domain-containing protein [Gracilimonas tropica]|uniref:helix-turn-helix domain-containing protein n=1 Tax=Gracilimonas tropica TaxID=454600 RepID=UPI000477B237|nr:AraC family transcriptional regulator [Gracilimonas tropica]